MSLPIPCGGSRVLIGRSKPVNGTAILSRLMCDALGFVIYQLYFFRLGGRLAAVCMR
jgi:hypothetical protein